MSCDLNTSAQSLLFDGCADFAPVVVAAADVFTLFTVFVVVHFVLPCVRVSCLHPPCFPKNLLFCRRARSAMLASASNPSPESFKL